MARLPSTKIATDVSRSMGEMKAKSCIDKEKICCIPKLKKCALESGRESDVDEKTQPTLCFILKMLSNGNHNDEERPFRRLLDFFASQFETFD